MPVSSDSQNPVPQVDSSHREPLAVIGIGCRLPGGINSAVEYWDALLRGLNAICDVPDDRWKQIGRAHV